MRFLHEWRGRLGLNPPHRRVELPNDPPRVLMYCSSDVGLGHFSRLNRIGTRLRHYIPNVNILFITDILPAPSAEYNDRFGILKLPGFIHAGEHSATSTGLELPLRAVSRMRQNIIMTTMRDFQPHLMLMDTGPHGKRNELQKPLEYLRAFSPSTYRVMQMRDIPIPPDEYRDPRTAYQRKMLAEHDLYDYFLVSGHPNLFNVAETYGWSGDLAAKVTYCGLVVPSSVTPAPKEPGTRRVIVSFGGGWEAADLAPRILELHQRLLRDAKGPVDLHLFTGPAIDPARFRELRAQAAKLAGFHVEQFSPHFPALLQSADLAILQSGSTPYQILESSIPMILYTRDYTTQEQQVRAQLLSRFPGVRAIDRDWLAANSLEQLAAELLANPPEHRATGLTYDGIDTAARILSRTIREKPARGPALGKILREEAAIS